MPDYFTHNQYYDAAALNPIEVRDVNEMIDTPHLNEEYRLFREEKGQPISFEHGGKYNHTLARKYPEDAELDIMFLCKKTSDFRVAYFLHHFLDLYLEAPHKPIKVSACRHWARAEMRQIFGDRGTGNNLLKKYKMKDDFDRAEDFFKGPKSQYFLRYNLIK